MDRPGSLTLEVNNGVRELLSSESVGHILELFVVHVSSEHLDLLAIVDEVEEESFLVLREEA